MSSDTTSHEKDNLPNILRYDNEVTSLYKWAFYYQFPVKFIVRERLEPNGYDYESVLDLIAGLLKNGESLNEIYQTIEKYNEDTSDINPEDMVMFYYVINGKKYKDNNVILLQDINNAYKDLGENMTYDTPIRFFEEYTFWSTNLDSSFIGKFLFTI